MLLSTEGDANPNRPLTAMSSKESICRCLGSVAEKICLAYMYDTSSQIHTPSSLLIRHTVDKYPQFVVSHRNTETPCPEMPYDGSMTMSFDCRSAASGR
ncbi:hypothetical protein Mapa_008504 [Marchantia paleacea]|nr:hypothetical protein Mapa_008504 [Marchantia paleacea]